MTKTHKRCVAIVRVLEWLHEPIDHPVINKLNETHAKRLAATFNPRINPYDRQDHHKPNR